MALILNRVKFTEDVEAALNAYFPRRQLGYVQNALLTKRNASIIAIRGDMDKAVRRQYSTLLTLFNEQLTLLHELLEAGNPQEIWSPELRFYANMDGTICCRSGGHELLVGDDFPATQMLVCTPLSRKARANLIEALMTGKIYSAAGPPGTGKTETIKDTFHMLGMTPSVVNSTDRVREAPTECIEAALTSGGKNCPVIFDDFNRIRADVMAAVAEETAGHTFCTLTYNPGCVEGSKLPEALKARRIIETPMTVPAIEQIVQVSLSCEGFLRCDELGKKLAAVVDACRQKMSKAYHYDHGMRFVKWLVKAAGAAGRSRGFNDEAQIVVDVLGTTFYTRGLPADREISLVQIKESFGIPATIPHDFEAAVSLEARVAAMVAAIAKTRHGIGIVGAQDIESTVSAIDSVMGSESLVVRAAPDKLFGEHGAFTQAFMTAAQKTKLVNIVIATPLDAQAAERLHTVLDDNKKLKTGPDGSHEIKMTPHMCVLLFDKDFATFSPALISRVGMVSAL
mmetsp:Transcript_30408/g.50321  ORF Transcript_30408/g.50321 Transcript_30408/m.50321 type:complete len:511 (-) Transcript_30408:178-1710(-)|eukprot:CAMPEP_0119307406 /NCGR_PEP_ID=MMETSP1333-20130426/7921_1 /TAXON_ID=418940 /ORGANISM="Scyphosphaera apsteinii, Strain RCC1455" /LENGTH=510 /DNA_ID=CAMNT_0007310949 /DNA_START=56 /DNA_END=1588 /DNA_ORIENTATION=-